MAHSELHRLSGSKNRRANISTVDEALPSRPPRLGKLTKKIATPLVVAIILPMSEQPWRARAQGYRTPPLLSLLNVRQ